MAGEARGEAPDIKTQLLAQGERFSFVQVVRLLRYFLQRETGASLDEHALEMQVRVRPELSLSFPEADVSSVERIPADESRYLVTATFLGLYGVSSPLPTFYTEDLFSEQSRDRSASREFLDVVNARIYALFFLGWARHRLFFNIVEDCDPRSLQRLYCLLGLDGERFQACVEDCYPLLRYIGLTTQTPRSAAGLEALLRDALAEPSVQIVQGAERVVRIPDDQRFRLGLAGNGLGTDAYMGEETVDRMGKFRVRIGPVKGDAFSRFLPGEPAFERMGRLIRFYLDQPLVWDVEVNVDPEGAAMAQLGDAARARLGWNTWIFSGDPPRQKAVARFTPSQ